MLNLDKLFRRTSLGFFPSPLHQLTRMSDALGVEIWAKRDDPVYDKVGNILLTRIMGGHPIMAGYGYSTTQKDTWDQALEEVRKQGGKPYAIRAGASDHPLGGLGYANFADEVAKQEEALGVFFDNVIVATCTGSTQAGMVAGFAAQACRASRPSPGYAWRPSWSP